MLNFYGSDSESEAQGQENNQEQNRNIALIASEDHSKNHALNSS